MGIIPSAVAELLDLADELDKAEREPAEPVATTTTKPPPRPITLLPITIYKPEHLYKDGDPSQGFQTRTTGTSGSVTWEQFGQLLGLEKMRIGDPIRYPDPKIAKSERGGFSTCALEGGRRIKSAFRGTQIIGLDIDHHGDVDKALAAFAPFQKIVLETYSSTDEEPRCRAFLQLAQLCTSAGQLRRGHLALRNIAVKFGFFQESDFDSAGQDPERLWFLPMRPPGSSYRFVITAGNLLDLNKLAGPEPPKARRGGRDNRPTESFSSSAGALAHVREKQAAAVHPNRHRTAYSNAAWLAGLEPFISDDDIYEAILPYAPEDREKEFAHAIRDGIKQGRGT